MRVRTPVVFGFLVLAYLLLALPAYIGPNVFEEFSSYLVFFTLAAVYIAHKAGIPGLLEHAGNCGWGICAPTVLGWIFLAMFWLGVAWLLAWGIASLIARARRAA